MSQSVNKRGSNDSGSVPSHVHATNTAVNPVTKVHTDSEYL
jgi:hypothetical protein